MSCTFREDDVFKAGGCQHVIWSGHADAWAGNTFLGGEIPVFRAHCDTCCHAARMVCRSRQTIRVPLF